MTSPPPLAEVLRPLTWELFENSTSLDSELLGHLQRGEGPIPSLILWGPPGVGKTTFARLLGRSYHCHFESFSAVLGGVKDVREIVARAREEELPTLLFVDEIHRFNKAQQDAFLPHIEDGTIALIGATTENPSFSLVSALLSRVRVVVMKPLPEESLQRLLSRALAHLTLPMLSEAEKFLIEFSGGDARKLLTAAEGISTAVRKKKSDEPLSRERVAQILQGAGAGIYDREGEQHYDMISAMIKSLRGSDPDAALFWAFRMIESGEPPEFLLRRCIIFASEDIGNADPRALMLAVATAEAFRRVGLPEGKIPLAQCLTYLATAPKSNRSYLAMHKAIDASGRHTKITVPVYLRNAPTQLLKEMGYGKEYLYPHDMPNAFAPGVTYLPEEVREERFYEPSNRGYEKTLGERMEWLRREK